ncbi:MAG: hypothetical protein R2705_08355 [Ilumatobacteraceae bacterium]
MDLLIGDEIHHQSRGRQERPAPGLGADCGFVVADVRDAPDRPGLEFVFLANTSGRPRATADGAGP